MANAIYFDAVVSKVATMTDGGLRVTFDLPENAIDAVAELMKCKREEMALRVACAVIEPAQVEDERTG